MPLFTVIANSDPEAVQKKVEENFDGAYYQFRPDIWIVDANTTSGELADMLGVRNDPAVSSGLVVAMSGYSGRAENDLWEWLQVRWAKTAT